MLPCMHDRLSLTLGLLAMASFWALHAAVASPRQASEVEMLSVKIADERYELTTYDERGRVQRRTDFLIGSPDTGSAGSGSDDMIELTIEVLRLDDDGEVASRKTVSWVCNPQASRMVMPILVLSGSPLRRDARLEVLGTPILYPEKPSFEGSLPDVELTIEIEGGILSLLGSRGRFFLENRRATREGDHLRISGQGEFKGYLAGIRFKHARFASRAELGPNGKLTFQEVTFRDGRRSTVELRRGASATGQGSCQSGPGCPPVAESRWGSVVIGEALRGSPRG